MAIITYDPNGGSGSVYRQSVSYGNTWIVFGALFELDGHSQTSWNTRRDGTGTAYNFFSAQTNMQTSNLTLYAIYKPNGYELTVNPNGGTWDDSTSIQKFFQEYGTKKEISDPTRVGYDFIGWKLNGYGFFSDNIYIYGAGEGELVAQWQRSKLKVTFDASTNGGSPNSDRDVYYGDTVGTLPVPSKPFYKFIGWFTKAVGGTQVSANNVITSDITFYAQYKIDASVKVKYNGNKLPAIVWVKVNGAWKKCITWIKDNGKWNKSTGAD